MKMCLTYLTKTTGGQKTEMHSLGVSLAIFSNLFLGI